MVHTIVLLYDLFLELLGTTTHYVLVQCFISIRPQNWDIYLAGVCTHVTIKATQQVVFLPMFHLEEETITNG